MLPKLPKQFTYALFVLIPFALIFFSSPFWHNVKLSAMSAGSLSLSIVRAPVEEARRLVMYRQTWKEHQKLQKDVSTLRSRLVTLEEVTQQNLRLGKLLDLKNRAMYSSEAARVIGRDPANWNASFMISKGTSDRIRPGMPVINATGVVGKVAEVAGNVSKVILITDPGFRVAVVNQRSRESALLSGSLSGNCRLDYLPRDADIRVGDDLVTASLSDFFPEGLLVGTVSDVQPASDGAGPQVEIEPAVDVARVEEVLVIKQ